MFKNLKEKYNKFGEAHPAIKEWFEAIVFVLVMVIIIRYFLMKM